MEEATHSSGEVGAHFVHFVAKILQLLPYASQWGVHSRPRDHESMSVEKREFAVSKAVAIIGTRGYPSYYGGFETAVRKLAPHLADGGWNVTVYGRHGSIRDSDVQRDTRVASVVTSGFEKKSLSTLSYGLTAVLHALRHKPDVALVMNVANGFWLPLLALRGIPTIVNVDGIEWERAKWGPIARMVFKAGARMVALFGTELIADAQEIQRRWRTEFGRETVFIPYGGDVPARLPTEPGLESGTYILAVARFVPENTMSEFFEAVESLAVDHDVVIVGSTGYGGELDDKASDLQQRFPNVRWLGHISDDARLLSLWQHAGAYFHGHSVGGTNPALVQAMACGVPIVARDTVYNREVLGDTALFVPPESESIAATIEALLQCPPSADETAAIVGRARKFYSWQEVCERYEATLRNQLRGQKK